MSNLYWYFILGSFLTFKWSINKLEMKKGLFNKISYKQCICAHDSDLDDRIRASPSAFKASMACLTSKCVRASFIQLLWVRGLRFNSSGRFRSNFTKIRPWLINFRCKDRVFSKTTTVTSLNSRKPNPLKNQSKNENLDPWLKIRLGSPFVWLSTRTALSKSSWAMWVSAVWTSLVRVDISAPILNAE